MLPSVALGIALAAVGIADINPHDAGIVELVKVALVLTLIADGLLVERELLRLHWSPVTRAIVLAMPVTLGLLGLAAKVIFPSLDWAEAFLLAAVLTPTDPVITSSVITSRRVPADVRHTLNLESGLNDGLALPFVLFFLVLAAPGGSAGHEGARVLGEAAVGAVIGIAVGVAAAHLHKRLQDGRTMRRVQGVFAVAVGAAAYFLADLTFGNGLIAAFVAAIALGAAEHQVPEALTSVADKLSSIAQLTTFFVFGALVYATGYDGAIWRPAVFVAFALLAARPLAIMISFLGEHLPRAQRAFVAWFGPKGVASMLFALLVLRSRVPARGLIFDFAAFAILGSIVAHGLTDKPGARWLARRSG